MLNVGFFLNVFRKSGPIIFPLILQTSTRGQMLSIGGEGGGTTHCKFWVTV